MSNKFPYGAREQVTYFCGLAEQDRNHILARAERAEAEGQRLREELKNVHARNRS